MRAERELVIRKIAEILSRFDGIRLAYIYGSFLREGDYRDIDLAVLLDDRLSDPHTAYKLSMRIGREVERCLVPRRPCDVRMLNGAPIWFRHRVIAEGRNIFSGSEEERVEYEAFVLSEHLDYAEVLAWFDGALLRRLRGEEMANGRRIANLLKELDEALADWKRYASSVSLDDLRRNRDVRNMVLHALLVAIQAAIRYANYLIAAHRLQRPETYRESFEILGEAGLIPPDLRESLVDLAGFRNVLVHIYHRLDLDRVYAVLQKEWKAIEEFEKLVSGLIR